MEEQETVKLLNPETGVVYTINLCQADSQRCETDLQFAQQMLNFAIKESTEGENGKLENTDLSKGEENDEKSIWSYNETLGLIRSYGNNRENFKVAKKRKHVWQDIANELESNGIQKTATKCETKWRNLLRTYKNVKDLSKSTGRGTSRFQFFELIDEIVGDTPIMSCTHTYSSTDPTSSVNMTLDNHTEKKDECGAIARDEVDPNGTSSTDLHLSSEPGKENVIKKRKRRTDDILKQKSQELIDIKINYFKKKEEDKYNKDLKREKKFALKEKMLKLEERKVALLEKYLENEK